MPQMRIYKMNIKEILKKFIIKYYDNIIVLFIIGIAAYSLFSNISINNLEHDELYTLNMLTMNNLFDIIKIGNVTDVNPPLYHAVMFFYTRIFDLSEYMIRIPSVVFFLITLYLIFIFTKRLFGAVDGIVSVLVTAMLFPHEWVSLLARGYALLVLFTVITMIFLDNIIRYKMKNNDKNISYRILICYIVSAIFCIYTHYFGGILVFSELFFLFIVFNKKVLKEIFIIIVPLMVFYVPWLLLISPHKVDVVHPNFIEWINWSVHANYNLFVVIFFAFIPVVPIIFDILKDKRIKLICNKYLSVLMLFFLFLFPYFLILFMYKIGIKCYQSRYLIISIIPFYILIAHGIAIAGRRKIIILIITVLFIIYGIKQKEPVFRMSQEAEYNINFIVKNHKKTGRPVLFIKDGMFEIYHKFHYDKYFNNETNKNNVKLLLYSEVNQINQTIEELSRMCGNNFIWVIDSTLMYDMNSVSLNKDIVKFNSKLPPIYLVKNKK